MDTSILIAKLIGPIMVVIGLTGLFNLKDMRAAADAFLANRALMLMSGILTLFGGLVIVNTHNIWTTGWPVIITVLGWLTVVGGIIRIAYPALAESLGKAMLAKEGVLRVAGAAQIVLGAFLMFVGYR